MSSNDQPEHNETDDAVVESADTHVGAADKQRDKSKDVSIEKTVKPAEKVVAEDVAPTVEPAVPAPAVVVNRPAAPSAVVGKGATDDVLLSRCVYKNPVTRKSLTVHHLQRRLIELGYVDANTDKDGWYGDHTMRAVKAYQRDRGMADTGIVDADTLVAVFDGDSNVTVVIDA